MRRNLQRENFAGAREMKQDKRNHAGAPDDPKMKKEIAKAYENYSSQFTPKPRYFMNAARAFMRREHLCSFSMAGGMFYWMGIFG